MASPSPQHHPPSRPSLVAMRWPAALVAVALVALAAFWIALNWLSGTGGESIRAAADIAERFKTGRITETFRSGLPKLESAPGGRLELATLAVPETITRSDERRVLWDLVSLGENVSEIRLTATYRYHVRVDGPWSVEASGQVCIVRAPPLQASLPPAFDTATVEKHTQSGWLRFDAAEQMDELERGLTRTLSRMAQEPGRLDLVRDEARRNMALFVRQFLLREDHWRADRFRSIIVHFQDEEEEDGYRFGTALSIEE